MDPTLMSVDIEIATNVTPSRESNEFLLPRRSCAKDDCFSCHGSLAQVLRIDPEECGAWIYLIPEGSGSVFLTTF